MPKRLCRNQFVKIISKRVLTIQTFFGAFLTSVSGGSIPPEHDFFQQPPIPSKLVSVLNNIPENNT